jgi:hypothetical protein
MRTRRLAVLSLVVLALAGCANNSGTASSSPSGGPVSGVPITGVPSLPEPSASATETISGTVSAGVEPHCLILQDSKGSHVLIFGNPSLRNSAPAGADVTLVGQSEPTMMTTCQQGVPFIVSSVRRN